MSQRRENWELERRLQTMCLLLITIILIGASAYWMRTVLIPFVLALFLFQILDPVVIFLKKRARLPHPLAVTATLALVAAVILYTSSMITDSVGELLNGSDSYTERMSDWLDQVWTKHPNLETRFKVLIDIQIEQLSQGVGSFLAALTNSVIYLISQSTVVLLFLTFLLLGSVAEKPRSGVLADIDKKIKNYLQVKTALSVLVGLMVGIVLAILNVELAFIFGMLTALLNFIPNVGPIIATLLPLPLMLVDPELSSLGLTLALMVPSVIHFVIGNLLEPKLLSNSLNLSPVVILLSLTIWTALWGGVGAFLAVPITATIQILCEQLDFTKPVSALLRGDMLAFIGSYKKLKATPPKDKSIPDEYLANPVTEVLENIEAVDKKL